MSKRIGPQDWDHSRIRRPLQMPRACKWWRRVSSVRCNSQESKGQLTTSQRPKKSLTTSKKGPKLPPNKMTKIQARTSKTNYSKQINLAIFSKKKWMMKSKSSKRIGMRRRIKRRDSEICKLWSVRSKIMPRIVRGSWKLSETKWTESKSLRKKMKISRIQPQLTLWTRAYQPFKSKMKIKTTKSSAKSKRTTKSMSKWTKKSRISRMKKLRGCWRT